MFKLGTIRDLVKKRITRAAEDPQAPVLSEHYIDMGGKLQAFSRKDLETSIQLFLHLKNLGYTFQDLIAYINMLRDREKNNAALSSRQRVRVLTRGEKKHLKRQSKKGARRRAKAVPVTGTETQRAKECL